MDDATGGRAFPWNATAPDGTPFSGGGMNLRDWFAGQALSGMTANEAWNDSTTFETAQVAYAYADAMIAERAKS